MHGVPRRLFVLGLPALFLALAAALAQGMTLTQEPERQPEQEKPAATDSFSKEQIEAKIKEIEGATHLEAPLKTKVLEAYGQALLYIKEAEEFRARAKAHGLENEEALPQTAEIRKRLAEAEDTPPPTLDTAALAGNSIKELEALLSRERVSLTQHKSALADLEKRIKADQDLPALARQQQIEARNALEEAEGDLKAPVPQDEPPVLTESRRTLLEGRVRARTEEIDMLEQALLSRPARLDLLTAQRDALQIEVTRSDDRCKGLEEYINERRLANAEEASAEAKEAVEKAEDRHPVLGGLAKDNEELSKEWVQLESWNRELTQESQRVEGEFLEAKDELETVRDRLTQIGFTETLGQDYLRDQYKDLAVELQGQQQARQKDKQRIYDVRVRRWKAHDRYKLLEDLDEAVDRVLHENVVPEDQVLLRPEIMSHLTAQRELLKKLDDAYDNCYDNLISLDTRRKELEVKLKAFTVFLDERLLWIPSTLVVDAQTLKDLKEALRWLSNSESWSESVQLVVKKSTQVPILTAFIILVLALLLIYRKKMIRRMATIAEQVGKVSLDRYAYTLEALIYTFLLAAPLPVILGYISWLIAHAPEASEFTKALGFGLDFPTKVLMFLLFLFSLCRRRGLAGMHFKWSESTKTVLRRNLMWFTAITVPMAAVIRMVEAQELDAYRGSLGRLALLIGLIALAVFFQRLLRTRGGITENHLAQHPNGWLARLRLIWYPAAVGIPAMLAVLSIWGYNYTARQLNWRFIKSLFFILCIVLIRDLVLRWLRIAQRKMKLARMQQELEESRAAKGAESEEDDADLPTAVKEAGLDLDAIDEQSQRLVRTAVAVAVMVGLWLAWAEMLPALNFLVNVEVWQHAEVGLEGDSFLEPVTLADLVLALLVLVLTIISARNLPGLMEITVLRRLPMDKGSRFAATTISSYVILAVGVVIAFRFIGVGWNQVQWLVAALGVGLGFGLQEIVANFISGLIILFERPIRVGDMVTIGDIDGVVSRIQIRATTITGLDRKELIVPNKSFITQNLVNWTLTDPVLRILIKLGVAHGSNTALVKKLLWDVIKSCPHVLEDPRPRVHFTEIGESALNFEVRVFVKGTGSLLRTRDELHMAIDKAFRDHEIRISFPQRDIHIRSMVETAKVEDDKEAGREGKGAALNDGPAGMSS